ncbi:ABC transporter ATP-binding protein [Microbacterium saperdae]|uniref:Peptide/nickel transport system ATP-binding protein n=1 Tax=Microbacterium saperdae TaxID=69368 RepID=A0A543BL99_9MICO|nr:ABC transporter ATP-binding protein [Microbacterium saperdae]TQL85602.1 peptide/nickel transport system ATP-binding protein [Microbacterium saperdae]GGM62359.1 ABC transporter ATP-binding protein [Microbacterium saperdae]
MTGLLTVRDLTVSFGEFTAVSDVSLVLHAGQITVLLGESGSGKTVLSRTIAGIGPTRSRQSGEIRFDEVDVIGAPERTLRRLRGSQIGFVAQDPSTSLDPVRRIGSQLGEVLRVHGVTSTRRETTARVRELLHLVELHDEVRVLHSYPHELSGGMRQRVAIALALAAGPRLLVADEPSSALDASVGVRIVDLIDDLRVRFDTSVLFVTHDVRIAARIANRPIDRVAVMLHGRLLEYGQAEAVLLRPAHPYTRALLGAEPRPGVPRGELAVVPDSMRDRTDWPPLRECEPGHLVAIGVGEEERL